MTLGKFKETRKDWDFMEHKLLPYVDDVNIQGENKDYKENRED
jgi:hypothetical protein